jgi:hypothetical protein
MMILPDCMMPDGADPCRGYHELRAEVERLTAAYKSRGGEMDSMREVLAETQKWNEDRVAEVERLGREIGILKALLAQYEKPGEREPEP